MNGQNVRQDPIAEDRQEFASSRAIWTIALAIALAESAVYLFAFSKNVASTISDPDDAMRLVQVREFLEGKGWYDQLTMRVNPPAGLYMHWSRLVDGGEAGLIWLFRLWMSNPAAELLGREVWPLLWILPAAAAALFFARNLGGRYSVVICAALLVMDILVFRQFRPGRLDHHNIQITLAIIAVAMASWPDLSWRKAALAGAASGLGLAIGLEALPVLAAVGIAMAARLMFSGQRAASQSYGASLAVSTAGFFLIQTPPSRWLLPFCDALAINLVAGIVILGAGLVAIAALPKATPRTVCASLVLVALLSGAVYLGIHPACMTGGFGDMDPRLRSIWLDMDSEVLPLTALFKYGVALVAHPLAMIVELALACVILWRTHRWSHTCLLVILLSLIVIPAAIRYAKFQDYLFWVGVPVFSAAMSLVLVAFGASRLAALLTSIAIAPASLAIAVQALQVKTDDRANLLAFPADCGNLAAYESLSRLKPGLVLSDIAIGPQILAATGHSVTGAPYHRLSTQIVRIHDAQRAKSQDAENLVRGMHAGYLVDCRGLPDVGRGLFHDLRLGAAFPWLERVSRPGEAVQIWRVLDPRMVSP